MRTAEAGRPGAPLTVGAVAQTVGAFVVTCRRCKHQRMLQPLDLAGKLGEDFPVDQIHRQLRCTECGKRDAVRIEVAWRD